MSDFDRISWLFKMDNRSPEGIACLITEDPDVETKLSDPRQVEQFVKEHEAELKKYLTPDDEAPQDGEEFGKFGETDAEKVSPSSIKILRKLIKLGASFYGYIPQLLVNFIPTAALIELIKHIKFYGDNLIGSFRFKRQLAKKLRSAVVSRMKDISKKDVELVMSGKADEYLDKLYQAALDPYKVFDKDFDPDDLDLDMVSPQIGLSNTTNADEESKRQKKFIKNWASHRNKMLCQKCGRMIYEKGEFDEHGQWESWMPKSCEHCGDKPGNHRGRIRHDT